MTAALALQLERAAHRLGNRLAQLEERLQQGEADAWTPYLDTAQALGRRPACDRA